ncbi:MAG TPA: sugar phosphate isomerase/epimerase [Candidatus Korarchaeota archaeon]|nr:sugar phosphate isomerase/epimerase [Candidatus Korarchaeota archaeon]
MRGWRLGFGQGALWNLSVEDAISELSKMGYEVFEPWIDHPSMFPYLDGKRDPSEILSLLMKKGINCTIHAPCHDMNIAGLNPWIRRESKLLLMKSVYLAAELEAEIVVIHPGRRTSPRVPDQVYIEKAIESLKEVCQEAKELGIRVGLENMDSRPDQFATTPEIMLELVDAINLQNVGITFDAAHANTCLDPIKFLHKVIDRVIHVHLSDNTGPNSECFHIPLGEGNLDLVGILRLLMEHEYDGILVFESGGQNLEEGLKRNLEIVKKAQDIAGRSRLSDS